MSEPIQIRLPSAPAYDCRSRLQAYCYLAACWLRRNVPLFDRRRPRSGDWPLEWMGEERRGR